MKCIITGKNFEIGERTREKIEKKLKRLDKIFPGEPQATVYVSEEKINYIIEVTIPLKRRILRAEAMEDDMMAAVDKVVDILESQIIKYKSRMRSRSRQSNVYREEYESIMVADEGLPEEPAFKIEKNKRFELQPMDVEEAVMQMELLGHNFFVFRNAETEEINVVYKRKNNSFGLIEPEN
ncbi:MAG: ribosome-associated translation inhibitor RaiA [Firmicutes bacterium]|nr:ribosome-associated translation inhibitor RaiA [Bacillota bacterium]